MVIVMRAMGVESDQEIMELIGSEPGVAALMASTVQEAKAAGIFTKQQALEYLGAPQCAVYIVFSSAPPGPSPNHVVSSTSLFHHTLPSLKRCSEDHRWQHSSRVASHLRGCVQAQG